MKREKKLTKKERKAHVATSAPAAAQGDANVHIHCVACGKHLNDTDFDAPASATTVNCAHGAGFTACVPCVPKAKQLLAEHDRTGQPVKSAAAWH